MGKITVCILGVLYCLGKSFWVDSQAVSIMHEIYGALYSLMAVIFLCTGFIIEDHNTRNLTDKNNKKQKS